MQLPSLPCWPVGLISLPVLLLGCSTDGTEGGAPPGGAGASAGGLAGSSGGSPAAGGSVTAGGSPWAGGDDAGGGAASGSSSATGGSNGDGSPNLEDLEPNTSCTLELTGTLAEKISTVGVITYATDLGAVDGGYIDFGPDETYGMRAPLDTTSADAKTFLLGMTQNSEFHYRVVAKSGDKICASDDATLTTGSAPAGVPSVEYSVLQPDKLSPGFLITSQMSSGGSGSTGSYALIYNTAGELVWWFESPVGGTTRAALSYDSKWMYVRDGNPSGSSSGKAARIAIDGSMSEALDIPRGHHDLSLMPDGVLFLSGGGTDYCGEILKLSSDGTISTVFDNKQAFGDTFQNGGSDPCHCNSIHYNPADESISVSCLTQNAYFKISTAGELQWRLGGNGAQSQFTGDIEWNRQHGHHLVSPNRIVFFNNNGLTEAGSQGGPALALELQLDLDKMTATRTRAYDGGHSSNTLGDTQILENENLLVTYSNDGVIREVDPQDQPVAEWTFPGGVGYSLHRPTLYGAPPRF